MKIALCSDLHLEFDDLNVQNDAGYDVLILAGDIMIAQDLHDHPEMSYNMYSTQILSNIGKRQQMALRYRDFLKRVSFQFPHVIVIAGNHEFYHGKFEVSLLHLREECNKFNNVYFLEDETKVIDDVVFVGATLWTDLDKGNPQVVYAMSGVMNDYVVIRHDAHNYTKLRPVHTLNRHRNSIQYFKKSLVEHKDKKCVIVSHHAPSHLSVHEQFKDRYPQNYAYYSDLSEFILEHPQIKVWCHGHMHMDFDYQIGDTRIVCHPRGYAGYERRSQEEEPYLPLPIEL